MYIALAQNDLVALITLLLQHNLTLKDDAGIISYNETPLEKFIINVISPYLPILNLWETRRQLDLNIAPVVLK